MRTPGKPQSAAAPMASNSKYDQPVKMGIAVWTAIVILGVCVYLVYAFIKGRRRFQSNLRVIEGGLKRMQEHLDRERGNSLGTIEHDTDEIEKFLEGLKNGKGFLPDKQEEEEGAAAAAAGAQLEVGNPGSEGKVEEAAANHSDDESKKTV